jgi:transposase
MPWRECSVMEERRRFVARLLDGESMSDVCREFGISRKTGYKIFNRYRQEGLDALCDRSRRPVRYANQLPEQVERLIVEFKRDKPHWGARKIRELLVRKLTGDLRIPAKSTVPAVLDRHGLVKCARARRNKAEATSLSPGRTCNGAPLSSRISRWTRSISLIDVTSIADAGLPGDHRSSRRNGASNAAGART